MRSRFTFCSFLLMLFAAYAVRAQTGTLKISRYGRFDLEAASSVGTLTGGRFLLGDGSVARQGWQPLNVQPRTYTIEFPIVRAHRAPLITGTEAVAVWVTPPVQPAITPPLEVSKLGLGTCVPTAVNASHKTSC